MIHTHTVQQDVRQKLVTHVTVQIIPFMNRCHCIGQLMKSRVLVNAWDLVMQVHISHCSGCYCIISNTIHVLENVSYVQCNIF